MLRSFISLFKYFLPDKNFQNLYSSLMIRLFNFLSLKILSPIKVIFLILALLPISISNFKFTLFS